MLFDNPIFTDEMIEMIKSSYDPNSVLGYKRYIRRSIQTQRALFIQ